MRILVTGGAGFIGTRLVSCLVEAGLGSVVVVDNLFRSSVAAMNHMRGDVEFVEGDIRDRALLSKAMREVDIVYHLAAQANVLGAVADLDYSFTTNVCGTYNVLQEARQSGVKRMVFTSSREVYGEVSTLPVPETAPLNPKNAYGASKAAGELYCRVAGSDLEVVVLRLANVYGAGDRDRVIPLFVHNAQAGQPLTIYGEGKILDFICMRDVVAALVEAGRRDVAGQVINIGSGRGTTLPELAGRIVSVLGSSSKIEFAPARGAEVDRYIADITRSKELLDHNPDGDPLSHLEDMLRPGQHQGCSSSL